MENNLITSATIYKHARDRGWDGQDASDPAGQHYEAIERQRAVEDMFPDVPQLEKIDNKPLFRSLNDLRNNPITVKWLVKGYLEENTITNWFGDFSAFKSFLGYDLGIAVASNQKWAGQEVSPGPVFYMAGEGHGGITRRVKAICQKRSVLEDAEIPFFVSTHAVSLDSLENTNLIVTEILKMKKKYGNPQLIIIDTLATHFGSGDENSTKDMNNFLNNLIALRQKLSCTILIIHHTGHGDKGRSRGASSLDAGVDAIFKISRNDMHVCLHSPVKMKDGEPPADTWFKAEVINVGFDEDLNPITSLALVHTTDYTSPIKPKQLGVNQKYLLGQIPSEGISKDALQDSYKDWKGTDYLRQGFSRTLNSLIREKLVYEEAGLMFSSL
ncbi:AAA family ATPase [Thermodesulfobacteriota bacterium]